MNDAARTTVMRNLTVRTPLATAFDLFVGRFGDIKPREHNLLGAPIVETVFEPRVGGTIYDRAEDGTECHWARVLVFDPPHRLVFSWDIGPTWQIEPDPANASEVEVRFTPESADRTRIDLTHRHLDRHGPGWEGVSSGVDAEDGWTLYLDRYVQLTAQVAR